LGFFFILGSFSDSGGAAAASYALLARYKFIARKSQGEIWAGGNILLGFFGYGETLVAIRSLEKQPYSWQAGCRTPRTDKGKSSGIKLACGEQAAAAQARRPARAS